MRIRKARVICIPWLMLASFTTSCGAAHGSPPASSPSLSSAKTHIGTDPHCTTSLKTFEVQVADTDEARYQGLSGRSQPLAPGTGMLFEYLGPVQDSFYMRDTLIPLEIGFFDFDHKLIQTFEMAVEPDPAHPKNLYAPNAPYVDALEVAPGSLDGLPPGPVYLCIS